MVAGAVARCLRELLLVAGGLPGGGLGGMGGGKSPDGMPKLPPGFENLLKKK